MSLDPIAELKLKLADSESQKALADRMDISEQYLSDILRGRRGIGDTVLKFLKLKKRVVYERK